MSPQLPHNIYTDTPEQHPNLILGSLQLLFWVIFRPTAWRNHVEQIRLKGSWRNQDWWLLLVQGYFILPLLAYLLTISAFWGLGESVEEIAFEVAWGIAWGIAWGVAFSISFVSSGMNITVAFGVPWGVEIGAVLGIVWGIIIAAALDIPWTIAFGIAFGVAFSIAWGVVVGLERKVYNSIGFGLCFGLTSGIAFGIVFGIQFDILFGIQFHRLFNIQFGLIGNIIFCLVFGLAFASPFCLVCGIASPVAIILFCFRATICYPVLAIWNVLLYKIERRRTDNKPSLLPYHPAFWDEWQRLPLYGLDKHLVLVMQRNPTEGKAAINYLSNTRQLWAVQAAVQAERIQETQIEFSARKLERCTRVQMIRKTHRILSAEELEGPASQIFDKFHRLSKDIDAALNQNGIYNQRKALEAVANRLDVFLQELTRSSNKYALRFRPIATYWQEIIANHIRELIEVIELRQEIDDPYIFGNPLDHRLEVFMGRTSIGIRIEKLILDHRRPPLFLYGQRRMGKTSLLNNLERLLPNNIIPMFVDLQGAPSSAKDHAGFLYNLAKAMRDSAQRQSNFTLPLLTRKQLATDPFTQFDEWLDKVEYTLDQNTALLALDEFEALDSAITKGRFDEEDVLGMLRHLIQHRPRFKVLLAGSHTLEEFQRWASYLINVQVVHISYLTETEAQQLIEHPIKEFTLRYQPDAVQRVLNLTRCHPCLVQLLCSEIVALKNEQDPSVRRLATVADVEAAVPEALSTGSFFFADIQNNQIDALGLAILRCIAAQGEGATVSRKTIAQQFPDCNSALNLLLQRQLIEEIGDSYRFQVELIGRWFA